MDLLLVEGLFGGFCDGAAASAFRRVVAAPRIFARTVVVFERSCLMKPKKPDFPRPRRATVEEFRSFSVEDYNEYRDALTPWTTYDCACAVRDGHRAIFFSCIALLISVATLIWYW